MPRLSSIQLDRIQQIHPPNLSPAQAILIQKKMREELIWEDRFEKVELIAGADAALSSDQSQILAAWVLLEFPSLQIIERVDAAAPLDFPYVPGLLSFREAPALIQAYQKLSQKPDLVIFDGQGSAHPRRVGIAAHMGLLLDLPSFGCGKSRLCGYFREPEITRGSWSNLKDHQEIIGAVLRTKNKVSPVFISPGHRISLASSIHWALACDSGFRLPKPTREADLWSKKIKPNYKP